MMPQISAVALPDHLTSGVLTNKVAVVIDVLRATTTIAQALENGARCILPVASVDAARMIAHDRIGSLLCGERGGIKPEGFTLGNSPSEYTQEMVKDKDLVLTTTNGTRALHMCSTAYDIITASVTTLDAVCAYLQSTDRDAVLVCSGTDGQVSLEDCICAGMIAERLTESHALHDSALLLRHAAHGAIGSSFHAQRLINLGFGNDVEFASEQSISTVVPYFDPATGEITAVAKNLISPG